MPSGSERRAGVPTMHRFLVLVALMVAACAPLKPDPGSRAACSTFQEQIEGVWLDAVGRERALFVLGSNSNGWGCFALLNPVPEWGLDTPVAINAKVKRRGAFRTMVRGETTVVVNLDDSTAEFSNGSKTLQGQVRRLRGSAFSY